ncbi:MAG: methyltransferase domain-containing protein, partial [Candidatus Dadabacteria bacterium]|nr:methyltransferase domain-containing protein [Candidatus Dadabacteria bacterium]NIV42099.1 methyltransferase domain-containing protein [Candidatus Dadabacteria bacterium]NIX16428.1 methyltransferase domain-containing protein [Candidatus Dadabacteria bacterium]
SDMAFADFDIQPGDKVLDIGCGYGETCLDIGHIVGPEGEVLGLDCTQAFLDIANKERDEAGLANVRFELGDAQTYDLPENYYDVVYSRFGVMFFQNVVYALKNAHKTLKPGGKVCMIVWRSINDNPCWGLAKEIALRHLPPPGENAATCGPGPFFLADEQTDRQILKAAGFDNVVLFKKNDAEVCVGTSLEEAVDFQILVGPSGEIIREAGELGKEKLPEVRKDMEDEMRKTLREDGVYLPSSTWFIMAKK